MPDKKATLLELEVHRRKLVKLVGELLEKADELDQEFRYSAAGVSKAAQERLATACNELSTLSETVVKLELVIKDGKVKEAQDSMVRAVSIATHLSKKLNEIKRSNS